MTTVIDQEVTLDDLNHFWTAEGLPAFYADRDDICDIVEGMGFSIYYLLGTSKKVTTTNTNNKHQNNGAKNNTYNAPKPAPQQTVTFETQWFKVVNNFVGRAVSKCAPVLSDDFISLEEQAHYNMPFIPHIIVDKLDQFFRLVDAQHGTESIVMLTYDLDKEGSEGWGILVPDQENTAAHCNYDPHSIAEMKPDNVMIVGSVHSHPKMAAYASGTDHADQADFDGIHITYGWQKSVNNGATQYHIELQMSGNAYTLQPEDVFEDFVVNKEPDPEVVEWTGKVKKELPPLLPTGGYTPSPAPTQSLHQAPITLGTGLQKVKSYDDLDWVNRLTSVYSQCSIPHGTILIGELDAQDNSAKFCPSCETYIDHYGIYDGFCDVCFLPIAAKGTSRVEVLELAAMYAEQTGISLDVPVYYIGIEDTSQVFVMALCEESLAKEIKAETVYDNYSSSYSYTDDLEDYLICCGVSIDDKETCFCDPQITYDDYLDYEKVIDQEDIYENKSKCQSCEYYYSPVCHQMKTRLLDYIKSPKAHIDDMVSGVQKKIRAQGCDQFEYYVYDLSSYDER